MKITSSNKKNIESDFYEKVFMVSGAGSGIGAAVTQLLLSYGAFVSLIGRTKATLKKTCKNFPEEHYLVIETDITKEENIKRAVDLTIEKFGKLDGSFNNAGIFGDFRPLHQECRKNIDAVLATNVLGTLLCMKYQIKVLLTSKEGVIVNCASVAAHLGHSGSAVYSASKHAIVGMSKSAALQYSRQGIRVNVVSPGSTETPMLKSIYTTQNELAIRANRAPLGRLGQPEEIAHAALWLLSSNSSYVTGQEIVVDGGVLAGKAANTTFNS
ncbi:SDR family NAD(P)-dependent oxidoreductase [Pleurocapsa sp. PCC 7319]|uniref:SDR family NAD(P)-dependent oxidoreductase n=1 Tax=Pleurocapsa sp. PCC 7319 TaxID=118161 RepID=UPI0003451741|nr:SDR family oxidoreductase [Pleurocapsa sp. PCC 7319]